MTTKELEERLFELPLQDRARLADRLLSSLELSPDAEWFEALDGEVAARFAAAQAGQLQTLDGNESIQRMWKLLGQ